MLNGKFALALAAAMVLATLYGCSSSSGIKNDRDEAITERDAALAAQMMAEQQRDDALTAQMMAEEAQAAADTARMTAEEERDAANMARTTAMEAEAAAVAAKMTAEMAQDAAETAQVMAVAAKMTAETAQMMAVAAQGMAEGERDAAQTVANDAVTAQMTAETERDAAVTARDEALTAQMTAETERDDAVAAQMMAEAAQMMAEAALDAALVTVSYNQAYTAYTAANTAYINALIAYGAMPADVDDATDLVSMAAAALAAANRAVAAATNGTAFEQAQASAAVTAAGNARRAAGLELMEANTTMSSMPYAMAIQMQDETAGMEGGATASRDGNIVTVTAVRSGDDGMFGGVNNDDVSIGKVDRAISQRNGWYKALVTNMDDAGQTATVYTDIENTMEKFSEAHTDGKGGVSSVADGVLTLPTDLNQVNDAAALILFNSYAMSSAFPSTTEGTVTYAYGDETNTDATERPGNFAGTFNSIPGKFACAETCTIGATDQGISVITGVWTFIPAYLGPDEMSLTGEGEAQIESRKDDLPEPSVPVDDDDYLRFGWWTTVDADDSTEVSFRTFYGGQEAYNYNGFAVLENEAKYVGPAAGRYAAKSFNANATLDSLRHGEFTATATLMARFGGRDIAASKAHQIEGVIDGFKDENGQDMDGWSVTLKPIDTAGLTDGNGTIMTTTDRADGLKNGGVGGGVAGSPVSSGGWEAQFFGNPAVNATGAGRHPGSVAGEFDAHSSHGHVGGAFGAEKE